MANDYSMEHAPPPPPFFFKAMIAEWLNEFDL